MSRQLLSHNGWDSLMTDVLDVGRMECSVLKSCTKLHMVFPTHWMYGLGSGEAILPCVLARQISFFFKFKNDIIFFVNDMYWIFGMYYVELYYYMIFCKELTFWMPGCPKATTDPSHVPDKPPDLMSGCTEATTDRSHVPDKHPDLMPGCAETTTDRCQVPNIDPDWMPMCLSYHRPYPGTWQASWLNDRLTQQPVVVRKVSSCVFFSCPFSERIGSNCSNLPRYTLRVHRMLFVYVFPIEPYMPALAKPPNATFYWTPLTHSLSRSRPRRI